VNGGMGMMMIFTSGTTDMKCRREVGAVLRQLLMFVPLGDTRRRGFCLRNGSPVSAGVLNQRFRPAHSRRHLQVTKQDAEEVGDRAGADYAEETRPVGPVYDADPTPYWSPDRIMAVHERFREVVDVGRAIGRLCPSQLCPSKGCDAG